MTQCASNAMPALYGAIIGKALYDGFIGLEDLAARIHGRE